MADGPPHIEVVEGDITRDHAHAIVNAANQGLGPGGGVCGAIFAAAGPGLRDACAALGGCATGDAKATPGFGLPARFVIHTVGPVWRGGGHGEPDLLASCYRRSLAVADELSAPTVAFPAISTGIFGYPLAAATEVAVRAVREVASGVEVVRFVCFDATTRALYQRVRG